MANYKIDFQIVNDRDELYSAHTFAAEINDHLMQNIVDAMKANGGFEVELCDVQELSNNIESQAWDYIIMNQIGNGDEFFWENHSIVIDNIMPSALVEDANKLISHYTLNIDYFAILNGEEQSHTARCDVSKQAFKSMVEAVTQLPKDVKAFDFLKSFAPAAYEEIAGVVLTEAAQQGYKNAFLKDFPYKVYESVTL